MAEREWRESYESLGFYTALEIEEMLEVSGAYRRQAERWEGAKRSLTRQGITDAHLIEALYSRHKPQDENDSLKEGAIPEMV